MMIKLLFALFTLFFFRIAEATNNPRPARIHFPDGSTAIVSDVYVTPYGVEAYGPSTDSGTPVLFSSFAYNPLDPMDGAGGIFHLRNKLMRSRKIRRNLFLHPFLLRHIQRLHEAMSRQYFPFYAQHYPRAEQAQDYNHSQESEESSPNHEEPINDQTSNFETRNERPDVVEQQIIQESNNEAPSSDGKIKKCGPSYKEHKKSQKQKRLDLQKKRREHRAAQQMKSTTKISKADNYQTVNLIPVEKIDTDVNPISESLDETVETDDKVSLHEKKILFEDPEPHILSKEPETSVAIAISSEGELGVGDDVSRDEELKWEPKLVEYFERFNLPIPEKEVSKIVQHTILRELDRASDSDELTEMVYEFEDANEAIAFYNKFLLAAYLPFVHENSLFRDTLEQMNSRLDQALVKINARQTEMKKATLIPDLNLKFDKKAFKSTRIMVKEMFNTANSLLNNKQLEKVQRRLEIEIDHSMDYFDERPFSDEMEAAFTQAVQNIKDVYQFMTKLNAIKFNDN